MGCKVLFAVTLQPFLVTGVARAIKADRAFEVPPTALLLKAG